MKSQPDPSIRSLLITRGHARHEGSLNYHYYGTIFTDTQNGGRGHVLATQGSLNGPLSGKQIKNLPVWSKRLAKESFANDAHRSVNSFRLHSDLADMTLWFIQEIFGFFCFRSMEPN